MILALVMMAVLSVSAEVRSVTWTAVGQKPALQIVASTPVDVSVEVRDGPELVIRVPAGAPSGLPLPGPQGPLERVRLVSEGAGVMLFVRLAPETRYETRSEGEVTTIVFSEPSTGLVDSDPTLVADIYRRLFPSVAPPEPETTAKSPDSPRGLALGPFRLRPSLSAVWTSADVSFDSPEPARNHYLEIQPGLGLSAFDTGLLSLNYEARPRLFSSLKGLTEITHVAGARARLPLGSRFELSASHQYTNGILETSVVDPGREYFYDLARFSDHASDASVQMTLTPLASVFAGVHFDWTRFDEESQGGFFDYDRHALRAGLGYDLSADLKAQVTYTHERVPPPLERPVVETTADSLTASVERAIGPLMSGTASIGLRSQRNPAAAGKSRSWAGVVCGASLQRALGHTSSLEMALNRGVQLSAFETNAYYISNSATLAWNFPLPLAFAGRASLLWWRNGYPNEAAAVGERRRDRILGWGAGLGRNLGRRLSLRVDYRVENRDSNVPGLDVTTGGLTFQAGFSAGAR